MDELLAKAMQGVDPDAPGAFWQVFFNLMALVPWTALTLWSLLPRVTGALRKKVYAKLRALSPPPKGVGEPEVLRLDEGALGRWKDDFSVTW